MNKFLIITALALNCLVVSAAIDTTAVDSFRFTTIKANPITAIKNQASSGTCWSFSGLGFFESELMRMGKPELDLSEMFVVHHSYSDKATKFVRTHGTSNFGGGGSFYDVMYVIQNYGIVPEEDMKGLNYGQDTHKHGELDALTESYVRTIIKNPNRKLSTAWKAGFDGILNAYLGECPKEFKVDGKQYSPKTYAKELGLDMDDYVSLTSYSHHPFYSSFAIEIPDNWRWALSYNLPIEEFAEIFENAVTEGYTIAWGSDVSEKGFSRKGVAVNPELIKENLPGTDQAKWLNISQKEMEKKILASKGPQPEVIVTQELRQEGYDNYETTDDHGMVIYGLAKDQNGTKYYMVKNSWGTTSKYKGIWYASESFVLQKTMNIVVHKDAIPRKIRRKLGIK